MFSLDTTKFYACFTIKYKRKEPVAFIVDTNEQISIDDPDDVRSITIRQINLDCNMTGIDIHFDLTQLAPMRKLRKFASDMPVRGLDAIIECGQQLDSCRSYIYCKPDEWFIYPSVHETYPQRTILRIQSSRGCFDMSRMREESQFLVSIEEVKHRPQYVKLGLKNWFHRWRRESLPYRWRTSETLGRACRFWPWYSNLLGYEGSWRIIFFWPEKIYRTPNLI